MEHYQKVIEEIIQDFSANLLQGLTSDEVRKRLALYGRNVLPAVKGPSVLSLFVRQFANPLMGALMLGAGASVAIAYYKEASVIGLALLVTAIVGFIQEWKAERDIALLKSYDLDTAKVRRGGVVYSISAAEVVPGDLLILEQGMKVVADVRLSKVNGLQVQEALLTGESQPVDKAIEVVEELVTVGDRTNMAYAGTFVVGGEGEGIVVATGAKTYVGSLSDLLRQTERPRTPLQDQIQRLSWWLGIIFCCVTVIVVVVGYARGMSLLDVVITGIALAVAAIPESLPVALTVILAVGMRRMVKRNALVRHLVAAETLGNVSVVCADKTGTLTQGRMQVVTLISADQEIDVERRKQAESLTEATQLLLAAAVLNTDVAVKQETGALVGLPTEVALAECARDLGLTITKFGIDAQHLDEIPFTSDKKLKVTLHKTINGTRVIIVKGAPENVFKLCTPDTFSVALHKKAERLTSKGLRLLAVAIRKCVSCDLEKELKGFVCLGLVALHDPMREQAPATIEKLREAGIRLVVVTGDHKDTALSLAQRVGLTVDRDAVITGAELGLLSDVQLEQIIEKIVVFARVEPAHKISIVNAWRKKGVSVAMVGDGVNDAPALKAATIGVAIGSGASVTHEIADMILLDDNLATIGHAVHEGRIIFDNIRKVIMYLVAHGFAETAFIGLSIIFGLPLPLLPTQIFWMNLITDALPYVALAIDYGQDDIMRRKPLAKDEPIVNGAMKRLLALSAVIIVGGLFAQYLLFYRMGIDLIRLRSILFTAMVVDILCFSISARYLYCSAFLCSLRPNYWLWIANILGILLQLMVLYVPFFQHLFSTVPLTLHEWMVVVLCGGVQLVIIEGIKLFYLRIPTVS